MCAPLGWGFRGCNSSDRGAMIRARRRARELPPFRELKRVPNAGVRPTLHRIHVGPIDQPGTAVPARPGGQYGSLFWEDAFMSVKLAIVVVAAAVVAAGCDQGALKVAQARADSLQNVAADHDRAMAEVAADARALSDISTEMAKVRLNGKMKIQPAETPEAARRDTVVERVRLLVSRVHSANAQLKTSRDQIASMTHLSDSLRATLESTVVNFQKEVDDQKTRSEE